MKKKYWYEMYIRLVM